ncbi:UNVERIFIED_ORG: type 1 fimbria pilin [Providencia alcalifaciens]
MKENIGNKNKLNNFQVVCGIIVFLVFCFYQTAKATVDNWEVEGANGSLYIYGTMTESACRLDMVSAYQDIKMKDIRTGQFPAIGSKGESIVFNLRLTDCLNSSANNRDYRTGTLIWANNQPAVRVSFRANRDVDNPQLVKAQGISGIGLRIETIDGVDIRLGNKGRPLLLNPGQNTLSYRVTPERTSAILVPGSYQAIVNFNLSYD